MLLTVECEVRDNRSDIVQSWFGPFHELKQVFLGREAVARRIKAMISSR